MGDALRATATAKLPGSGDTADRDRGFQGRRDDVRHGAPASDLEPSASAGRRRILYIQYTNPAAYPPLEHSSQILADAGWEVLFLGTGTFGADALEFPEHPRIRVLRMRYGGTGWRNKPHYALFCVWALVWAVRWRPSWIYASDLLACLPALMLSYLVRRPVCYHEHDSPEPLPADRAPPGVFVRILLRARAYLAARAQVCILPQEHRATHFREETCTSAPIICVWNCPAAEEAGSRPRGRSDGLRVMYMGSLGPENLPLNVLSALAMLPEAVTLQVIGISTIGQPRYDAALRSLAAELGLGHRIHIVGPLPRKELLARCRRCHVGLAFTSMASADVNRRYHVGASCKPFDYLACGAALLVSDLPDWRRMYVDPGYGRACDPRDPDGIAEALRWFLEHPDERIAMGEAGRQRILGEWNYEQQLAPVLTLLRAT